MDFLLSQQQIMNANAEQTYHMKELFIMMENFTFLFELIKIYNTLLNI